MPVAITAAAALAFGAFVVYMEIPNFTRIGFHEYFELDPGETVIVVGDRRITGAGAFTEGRDEYFPAGFVKEYLDEYIYWDQKKLILTFTDLGSVIRYKAGELTYSINHTQNSGVLSTPVIARDGEAFIPGNLLSDLYGLTIAHEDEFNITVVDKNEDDKSICSVKAKKTYMRYKPDRKAYIGSQLYKGDGLSAFGEDGEYTRVRAANGLLGYVLTKDLTAAETVPGDVPAQEGAAREERVAKKTVAGKINMIWDQITVFEANSDPFRLEAREGLDVVSPTWFYFDTDKMDGDIISLADASYVNRAHENGCQVWALIDDFSRDPKKTNSSISRNILSDTVFRERSINRLLGYVAEYGLDGINIDFEYVQKEDVTHYLQFLRELSVFMGRMGKVLSVDVYNPVPPAYWSSYYNRGEISKYADYVCVMAYDEHISGGPVGPVASVGFVETGVEMTLLEVPKEKVLLGLPYYVRVWRISAGEETASVRNYGMRAAYEMFSDNGAAFVWDETVGSYYGEYRAEEDGETAVYKTWLESERSIEKKLEILVKHDLAGAAGWKRGLETEGIWDILIKYLK